MAYWDFWCVVSVAGMLQAVLLLIYLVLNKSSRTTADLFVALLLLWIIWLQLEFIVLRRTTLIANSVFFGTRHGAWLLPGPLVYHYVVLRIGKTGMLRLSMLSHYIPFIVLAVLIPVAVGTTIPDRVINYGMLSVLKFPMLATSWLNTAYGYVFIAQFIHAGVYLAVCIRLISRFQKQAMSASSDNRITALTSLRGIVGTAAFFTMIAVLFIAVLLKSQWYVRELDYLYILPMTFCIYLLSYYAIRQPSVSVQRANGVTPYQQSRLTKEESARLFEHMNALILERRLYMNPELRLSDLAEATGLSYHQISEVINREAGTSFFDFINAFRVTHAAADFEKLIRLNKKINILEVAFASGFNNKVSFNRHFKKATGHTPSAFIKEKSRNE